MCLRRVSALALVLACLPALDRVASGQAAPPPDPRADARTRLGPFYITPSFLIRDVGIDTNVFDSPVNPVRDFTATLVPRADVWVPFARRALLASSAGVGLVYYATQADARSIDPDLRLRGEFYGRRTTVYLEDRYLRTRDRSLEVDAGRARRKENSATAGVAVQLFTKLTVDVSAYQQDRQYDDVGVVGAAVRQALSRTESGVRGAARVKVTPLTTVVLRGERQRTRFAYSPVRDADGLRATAGAEFSPRALISGSAEVGVRQFSGRDPRLPDFTGLVAKAALNYTLLGTTRFGVSWDRDAIYALELAWPYAVMNAVGGQVRRQITGRWDGIVGAQRATYSYRNFTGDTAAERRDVTLSYTVDVGVRLSRDTRVGLAVTSWNRESNVDQRGYRDLRAGVSVTYRLPG